MLRYLAAVAIGAALVTPVSTQAAANAARRSRSINAREQRQADRIKNGVNGHELTRGERNRLKADEASIRAKERIYRQSGDGLSRPERRDLERDLNRTSREIYRDRHNRREPAAPK